MGCSNIAYPKLVIELMPDGEEHPCGAGLGLGSARGDQAALTHPKDVGILPESRMEKTELGGPALIPFCVCLLQGSGV